MISLRRLSWICLITVLVTAASAWLIDLADRGSSNAEMHRWRSAVRDAHAIVDNLTDLPVSRDGTPRPDRVATIARQMLVSAGVPLDAFAGIQPLGDTVLPGGAWHRQQVLVQLRGLNTTQVIAVSDAARRTDPAWGVSSIQLSHVGTDDRYDAGLALSTLYPSVP